MRVVSGIWRGRHIAAPAGRDTRPTADRVREAIFSAVYSIRGELLGLQVLDLYAGSGALGLEALSRGASRCVFVESDRRAVSVLQSNIRALEPPPDTAVVRHEPVERFASKPWSGPQVSLLLADPPYRIDGAQFIQVLEELETGGALEPRAVVVYEHAAGVSVGWPGRFVPGPEKRYGDTAVSFATYEG